MPAWLIKILVNLAISLGMPYLVKFLPNIPTEVLDAIKKLLEDLASSPKEEHKEIKREAKKCIGALCQTEPQKS